MPLDLNELMKKAKKKGIFFDKNTNTKPWHQESIVIKLASKKVIEDDEKCEINQSCENQQEKTPDKHGTIRGQTGDNNGTIRGPLENKQGTIREQTGDNNGTIRGPLENKQGTIRGRIREHLNTESYIEILKAINSLAGLQKKLFFHLIENCSLNGTLETTQIISEELRFFLNSSAESLKTTIKRLIQKNLIKRNSGKTGRGGFVVFAFDEMIRKAGIEIYNKSLIKGQTGDNWVTKQGTYKNTSSGSSYISTATKYLNIPNEPPPIDVAPLQDIGLTQVHILQLTKAGKLTVEQIQDSINFFAFDLAYNNKANSLKKTPLDFFMGILRQGHPYAASANYESPETQSLRLYLDSKRQAEQMAETLETQAKDRLFQEWQATLSSEELEAFSTEIEGIERLSEQTKATLRQRNALAQARQHFEATIWPEKRKSILEKQ